MLKDHQNGFLLDNGNSGDSDQFTIKHIFRFGANASKLSSETKSEAQQGTQGTSQGLFSFLVLPQS